MHLLPRIFSGMYNLEEQINNFLYIGREKWQGILRRISAVNVTAGLVLLVIRFGFLPDEAAWQSIQKGYNILFLAFAGIYLARLVLKIERLAFLRKTWFEGLLNLLIVLHALIIYFSDGFNPLLLLIGSMNFTHPLLVFDHFVSIYLSVLLGLELTKLSTRISELSLDPAATFIYSFILLIALGTGLLMLPAMTVGTESMNFIEALFTAVSASCVTGLSVVDTGTWFTFKGQLVIMLLFQVGGIGIVSFATFFATFLSRGVSIKQQSIIQDHLSSDSLVSAKDLLKKVVLITLSIELIGFLAIFFSWGDLRFESIGQRLFYSLFHAISAFCNAGFSLFPDGLHTNDISEGTAVFARGTDVNIRHRYLLHLIIALLIILGGVGFNTIEDVLNAIKKRQGLRISAGDLRLGTKLALYATGILLAVGTIGFMLLEAHQLRDRNILAAFNTAFFQSVTTRTAGFHTMNFGGSPTGMPIGNPTVILCLFLMFIGASPGSTGGGIKNTTFLLILLSAQANIRGKQRIEIYRRTIPGQLVSKAFSVFMFATSYNLLAIFVLSITEAGNPQMGILQLAFEQISAFATVGLSMGVTSELSAMGKLVIICSMYIGRVGTITLALALSSKVITNSYRYPEGHVMVG